MLKFNMSNSPQNILRETVVRLIQTAEHLGRVVSMSSANSAASSLLATSCKPTIASSGAGSEHASLFGYRTVAAVFFVPASINSNMHYNPPSGIENYMSPYFAVFSWIRSSLPTTSLPGSRFWGVTQRFFGESVARHPKKTAAKETNQQPPVLKTRHNRFLFLINYK